MRYLLFLLGLSVTLAVQALTLQPNAPARYVVQPGDTLWGIANRFLAEPWQWRALWQVNPQVKNPNRLYPGAILELSYHQRNPYLKVLSNGTIKLSPYMRPKPLENPIPPIPLSDIKPFLNGSLVLDKDSLADAPYIVAFNTEHMLGGQGDEMYVKNLCPGVPPPGESFAYALYRPTGEYKDPETDAVVGYKASLIAYAELVRRGDPATIVLTDIMQGVRLNDRVMPRDYPEFALDFEPRTPSTQIFGSIIDTPGDYSQGAAGLVVVVDRGKDAGVEPGDVLAIYEDGHSAPNVQCPPNCVELPPERIGEAMVFRTFTHTSFALVVRAIRAIKVDDKVTNP